MGTELARRGVPTPAPLWSAAALDTHPEIIEQIHADYVAAGADILVANTFRTNPRMLARCGIGERGGELTQKASNLARSATHGIARRIYVAASVGPVEDCYRADLTPPDNELRSEHRRFAEQIRSAGVDLIWIETMGTAREAIIAAQTASQVELPFAICFMTREDGDLLGGDLITDAVEAILPLGPVAVGLNCGPPTGLRRNFERFRESIQQFLANRTLAPPAIAVYAHIGNPVPLPGWSFAENPDPAGYVKCVQTWLAAGATIVGGCCGTQAAHIEAISRRIRASRGT